MFRLGRPPKCPPWYRNAPGRVGRALEEPWRRDAAILAACYASTGHSLARLRMRSRYASPMDIPKMLAEMCQGHAAIEEAILVLERLAGGRGRRRGRPPSSKNKPKPEV